MLEKIGMQKHRLFFFILPIFIIKFLIIRYFLFDRVSVFETIWVEIFYLIIIFSCIELITNDRIKFYVYIGANFVMSVLLIGLVLYYNYSSQIVSILLLSQLNQVGTVKSSVFKLLNPIYFIILLDLIVIAFWMWKSKWKPENTSYKKRKWLLITLIVLSLGICTNNVVANKNDIIVNTAHVAEKEGIFTYEILTIVHKFSKPTELNLSAKEIQNKIDTLQGLEQRAVPVHFGDLHGRNVLFIQLEAFQNLLINLKVNGQEITPFLNKLSNSSLYFSNIYQQISSGSTSDAEFISNTSLYPDPSVATSKAFGDRVIPSLPRLLQKEGYTTMTMHANEVTFWNRDELYPALGFNQWYDIEYFDEKDVEEIGIGISDRVLFNKSLAILKQLNDSNTPFYTQLITLTSHHPFVMDDEHKLLNLPEEMENTIVGDYLQAAHYVDGQLEQFFKKLEENGIMDNLVIVMYGDHQGMQVKALSDTEKEVVKSLIDHDYTFIDQFNIPLFIYSKDSGLSQKVDIVGGQLDIMPTVANLIGLSLDDHVHFGNDLLNIDSNLFGIRYYMPYGSFFYNDYAFKPETNYEDGTIYEIATRKELSHSEVNLSKYYKRIMQLLKLNDQYLNSLPKREDQ